MSEESSGGGMGIVSWLIVAVIILGLLGVGPCADSCSDCGPQPLKQEQAK